MNYDPRNCTLCPRECGADRTVRTGACGADESVRVAKVMLHRFEEPPLSGTRGSGAIFFAGCNLRCGYCQNAPVSQGKAAGEPYDGDRLAAAMLSLQQKGAHNIDLITAAHYVPYLVPVLQSVRGKLHIPVVYNSSGYEKAETLAALDGLVDIYLPDFKYLRSSSAAKYSGAADYPSVATAAIREMVRQTGPYVERDGIAVRGTIVRHLVLPSLSHEGEEIVRHIAENFPDVRVSILRQYTPAFNRTGDKAFDRRVTSLEYDRVVNAAIACGLQGFMQGKESASAIYTPDWN